MIGMLKGGLKMRNKSIHKEKANMQEKTSETMKRFHIFQLVTGLLLFAIFRFVYPNTICSLEEDDLFLFSGEYLTGVFQRPQGVAALIVNYIEQFFSSPTFGSIVYVLFLVITAEFLYLTMRRIGRDKLYFFAVMPSPVVALLMFPDLVPSLSMLFFALLLYVFVLIRNKVARCIYALVLPVFLYMVMPWAVAALLVLCFFIIEFVLHKNKVIGMVMLIGVAEVLLVPSLWSDIVSFVPFESRPFNGLGEGVTTGVLLIYAVVIAIIFVPVPHVKKWIAPVAVLLFSVSYAILLSTNKLNRYVERLHKVASMADNKNWSGILAEFTYDEYRHDKAYMLYSMLAESALGSLPHNLMKYPINNPEDFLFRHENNSYLLNFNRQFYDNLGIWDEAFHLAFEYGVNSRENECFKTLRHKTDYALATYDLGTAAKYINLLKLSSANGRWVSSRAMRLDSLKKVVPPERPYRSDTFVGAYPMESEMIRLLQNDSSNRKILDYLLCSLLLQKELNKFAIILKNFNLYEGETLPRVYAEAVAALASQDTTARSLGMYDHNLENQYIDCVTKARNGDNCSSYAGTYWTYLLFTQLPKKPE